MTNTATKSRPIIFRPEDIRAILDGRKTQTRRPMKLQPSEHWLPDSYGEVHRMENGYPVEPRTKRDVVGWGPSDYDGLEARACPYGKPGDLLWVREKWRNAGTDPVSGKGAIEYAGGTYLYDDRALAPDLNADRSKMWRSPIYMPRWASRITLEIEEIRAERLQDISNADAVAEGMPADYGHPSHPREEVAMVASGSKYYRAKRHFQEYWDLHNTPRGYPWSSNPWVWVISFKLLGD